MKLINFFKIFCMKWVSFYCRWQEEPSILISMLLLCVFCTTVCSQHLFGLPLRMDGMHRTQFDHSHSDLLSLVIWSCVLWPSDHVKCAQNAAARIGANIPVNKSENPTMCEFLLSHVVNGGTIPKGTQLRNQLLGVYAWFASLINWDIKNFCLKNKAQYCTICIIRALFGILGA